MINDSKCFFKEIHVIQTNNFCQTNLLITLKFPLKQNWILPSEKSC